MICGQACEGKREDDKSDKTSDPNSVSFLSASTTGCTCPKDDRETTGIQGRASGIEESVRIPRNLFVIGGELDTTFPGSNPSGEALPMPVQILLTGDKSRESDENATSGLVDDLPGTIENWLGRLLDTIAQAETLLAARPLIQQRNDHALASGEAELDRLSTLISLASVAFVGPIDDLLRRLRQLADKFKGIIDVVGLYLDGTITFEEAIRLAKLMIRILRLAGDLSEGISDATDDEKEDVKEAIQHILGAIMLVCFFGERKARIILEAHEAGFIPSGTLDSAIDKVHNLLGELVARVLVRLPKRWRPGPGDGPFGSNPGFIIALLIVIIMILLGAFVRRPPGFEGATGRYKRWPRKRHQSKTERIIDKVIEKLEKILRAIGAGK